VDPIKLSTDAPTPAPTSSAEPNGRVVTIAGHKITTHTIAVFIGLLLSFIMQNWPEAAPVVDVAREIIPKLDPAPSAPKLGPYETQMRAAWAAERDSDSAKKSDGLTRLAYLYRRSLGDLEAGKWTDFADLSKSFHESADKVGMTNELPVLRGVITSEWKARINKTSGPIDELNRFKVSSFLRETLANLDRLNLAER